MHYSQKPQFKYPGWVTERRPPPADIQAELRMARIRAAADAEARRAKRKNKSDDRPRPRSPAASE